LRSENAKKKLNALRERKKESWRAEALQKTGFGAPGADGALGNFFEEQKRQLRHQFFATLKVPKRKIRIRIEEKCWIQIRIRIHNPDRTDSLPLLC
jgi:hypothetical protein